MNRFHAITRRQGQWVSLCFGQDAEQVYRDAIALIEDQEPPCDDDAGAVSPGAEELLDNLRVVSEAAAREIYCVRDTSVTQSSRS